MQLAASRACTHPDQGKQPSKAWNANWDHLHNTQHFNPKYWVQSFKEFLQASQHQHALIAVIWRKAKMVRPMEATILQGVRHVLFNSGWEICNVRISEPGIFELADVETELRN